MIDLREQLAELADDVAVPHDPASDSDLWDRGRRYARRRRRGTVAAVLSTVIALVALGAVVELRSPDPMPAAPTPEGSLGLPDRVWEPSPWLPGTDETGPPGPLAMLRPTDRGTWWGMRDGVVGISARTGEYRFLDLPGARYAAASDGGVSLSPDGRKVAYWTADGTTRGEHTDVGNGRAATGVAIYDTTSGEVVRAAFESEHGFRDAELVWQDAETLLIEQGPYVRDHFGDLGSSSQGKPLVRWRPPGPPTPLEGWGMWAPDSNGRGTLTVDGNRWTHIMTGPRAGSRFRLRPAPLNAHLAVSPSATRAAYIRAPHPRGSRVPNALFVADLTGPAQRGEREPGTRVGTRRWFNDVVGWIDERRVVVGRFKLRGDGSRDLLAIDVETGDAEVLVRDGSSPCCAGPTAMIAADLLGAPTFTAEAPPRPWDPRVIAGLGLGVLLAGGAGIIAWRRRVAP